MERLRGAGLVATCNPGGPGKWFTMNDQPLHGRRVCIIPDNDDAGRKHANDIAKSLHGKAADVRIVELAELPPKGDVSDWLRAHSIDELSQLVDSAPHHMPESVASASLAWQSFPVHVLPELVRSFVVEGANAIGCDPAYIALTIVAQPPLMSGSIPKHAKFGLRSITNMPKNKPLFRTETLQRHSASWKVMQRERPHHGTNHFAQTGMTFGRWHQHARLYPAIRLLG